MAPLPHYFSFTKSLLFYLLFVSSLLFSSSSVFANSQISLGRRNLLSKTDQKDDLSSSSSLPKTKKTPISSTKNHTKLLKSITSKQNQTKSITPISSSSSKNKTHLSKPTKNVGATLNPTKLNLNSTKSLDLPKNKTKTSSNQIKKIIKLAKSDTKTNVKQKMQSLTPEDMNDEDYDFITEFRDLPTKFHKTFIPDIQKISTTSKIYLTNANKHITKNFINPYISKQYASSISTAISCTFIIIPFLLVSLLCNTIKSYFSLQKLIIFVQIYLSIYFSILCLSSIITGLEPLRFFYATSQSTYVWLQVLQTLGYVMYLLMLMMYLVLVFSTETGLGQKFLGLAQTFVGFAVGLHYYMTVFHRVVLHQPPKTNWKVHGVYATCFLVICLFAGAERRKKAYLEEDGEEGKLN